ncbi:MAG: hypothetical protein Q7T77_04715 [Sulfuricurvum sp.]|nr:hypothetical protein [Sulfuricurvum sp.]
MLKETLNLSTPNGVAIDFISYEENDAYQEAFKGAIHAVIIPLILAFLLSPLFASGYFITVAFLYSTVFRHKSQGFWGVVATVIGIAALLIVAV